MDKMEMYEAELLMSQMHLCYMEDWEQTRMLCYMIANNNPFRKHELPIKQIMTFSWDGKEDENMGKLTDEEIEQLRRRATDFEAYIRQNNNG